jgi:hypothetical protein
MAINYTTSFNTGELSDNMDARTDLEIYRKGCKLLENFYILPQGGVERRPGTEFIKTTSSSTAGKYPARLIPFEFSSDVVYVIEIGHDGSNPFSNVYDKDGTATAITGTALPYNADEIREIQYISRFDTLILSHPNHPLAQIQRTSVSPVFEYSVIDFVYPPFLDENTNEDYVITPSGSLGIGGTITLTASGSGFTPFTTDMEGGFYVLRHARTATERLVTDEYSTSNTSTPLDVSFSEWKMETDGTWNGSIELLRSTNGESGDYTSFASFDTKGTANRNFIFNSPSQENANTFIKLEYTLSSAGTLKFQLKNETLYNQGVVKINTGGVSSGTEATGTVINTVLNRATYFHAEGAFSDRRGFPRAAEFFQDRLFLSGTKFEPGTIYGSASGDYFNFIQGSFSDLSIKRIPNNPEATRYMNAKDVLFVGTTGGTMAVKSASSTDEVVTATNIETNPQNTFGSDTMQGFLANDAVIYTSKNKTRIRELLYDSQIEVFKSNDLNILNDTILSSTVVETYLQKNPNHFFWTVLNDGTVAILLYERSQEVVGWSRITTNGSIVSGAAVSAGREDAVWWIVNRGTTDTPKYCIEKFHFRDDLDWYVDSGKKLDVSTNRKDNVTFTWDGSKYTFTSITGLDDGNSAKLTNVWTSWTANTTFVTGQLVKKDLKYYRAITGFTSGADFDSTKWTVVPSNEEPSLEDLIVDIKDEGGSVSSLLIKGTSNPITRPGSSTQTTFTASIKEVINSIPGLAHLEGQKVQVVVDGSFDSEKTVSSGSITSDVYGSTIIAGLQYSSKLQPMPIEPVLAQRLPNSRVKGTSKIIARLRNSKGMSIGEVGKQKTNLPVLDTTDKAGEPISLEAGQFRFFIGSDYTNEKLLEIEQDLPYPLTLLSLASWVKVEGG